jgi:hypothetical protein
MLREIPRLTYDVGMPSSSPIDSDRSYLRDLQAAGFAFVHGPAINRELFDIRDHAEWNSFVDSWNDLATDSYLAEQGTFRRRRHAVFTIAGDGEIQREAHQPHYQSKTYNALQGGIERWFEPIAHSIGDGEVLARILKFCADTFKTLSPRTEKWRTEVHQFRIEARPDQAGLPTPEGVHRDGVDFVLVLLIARNNIASGTTTIHSADGTQLGSFTLTDPLDAALVDDERVFHGVTPVHAVDAMRPAFRDVLVITLWKRNARSLSNPDDELRT